MQAAGCEAWLRVTAAKGTLLLNYVFPHFFGWSVLAARILLQRRAVREVVYRALETARPK